jgi:3-methyladenine DNA glycosylase AlkD
MPSVDNRSMPTVSETLALLRQHARPSQLAGMARFGIDVRRRLGVSVPELRRIAKSLGRDHALAQALWECGIPDAQILAAYIAEPQHFTSRQMDAWVKDMHSWDVCDQACSNAFARSPLGWRKVHAWGGRREEFVRRAAFALLAALVVHDKAATDAQFIATLPLIEAAAVDERNFVKKAVNWALRCIGKRNAVLNAAATVTARRLRTLDSRSARWIAADALRELGSDAVRTRIAAAAAQRR